MATITSIKHYAVNFWRVEWTGTADAVFYIWVNGRLYDTTVANFAIVNAGNDPHPPAIEVLESGEESHYLKGFPHAMLQWENVEFAVVYQVQKYNTVSLAWEDVQKPFVWLDSEPVVQYYTGVLTDNTNHQYRVYAEQEDGTQSIVEVISFLFWRMPDPPELDLSVSSGTLTVARA